MFHVRRKARCEDLNERNNAIVSSAGPVIFGIFFPARPEPRACEAVVGKGEECPGWG
jgi:hypothetical protein